MSLTVDDLLAGYDNADWLGFGYLGERQGALNDDDPECPAQPDTVAEADERIVAEANDLGWSQGDLFSWSNSKLGRWYGDLWFGNDGPPDEGHLSQLICLPPDD